MSLEEFRSEVRDRKKDFNLGEIGSVFALALMRNVLEAECS